MSKMEYTNWINTKQKHTKMNKQSGFNAEQIEKDNYPESKTVWRLNLK